ncbi:MAG: fused MFS/spermidine synthase [Gemmatimonadaceae bacterium]
MQILLLIAFVLSGAAGLIYESIWSRYLGLFVGHSAYAQIIVLTIFLGGMSAGAMIIGRRSERIREPLVWYAAIEGIVGLIGLVFHDVYLGVSTYAYDSIFPALAGGTMLTVAKWTIAGALILPQSILLGTTFPLMSAGVLRLVGKRPGRVLSLLYFANSLGAAVGVLLAGFYLLAVSGLPGTLLTAAMINMVVALAVFIGVRLSGANTLAASRLPTPHSIRPQAGTRPTLDSRLWRLLLVLSFGTAVASFIYEIAWIRMLSQVLGSATHSFELMLSAFIMGLALGALWVHRRADGFRDPVRTLGVVQLCMGLAAIATLPIYLQSFSWTEKLLSTIGPTDQGYTAFTLARYIFCLAVMLPSTFFAGITLPLITRALLVSEKGERAIGTVYAVNTLGSIAGVMLAGLLLMPLIGLKMLLILGATIDMGFGVLLMRMAAGTDEKRRQFAYASAAAVAAMAIIAVAGIDFDKTVLSSGVYRYGKLPAPGSRQMTFYKDGRTATVAVGKSTADGTTYISTNGKPDASLDSVWFRKPGIGGPRRPMGGDVSTQVLLPLIVLAHVPRARHVAVIGQGSGMTSHFLLGSPNIQELVTIEIEPSMIEGSRGFYPVNRRVFEDKRSRFVIDDAKSFFAASKQRYDIILSEPSNPWVSGVSGLFTTEFYGRVRRYLSDDGVFGQWLHLYEISDGLVLSVLAALHQNFPSYQVYMTSVGDMLIVASNSELRQPDWSVFRYPMIEQDLTHAFEFTPRFLDATRSLPRQALAPLLDGWGQPNSDYFPVLDLGTERTRFRRTFATGFASLSSDRFDIIAPFFDLRSPFSTDQRAPIPNIARMQSLAIGAALRDSKPGSLADSAATSDVAAALQRHWRLQGALSSNLAPADWRLWLIDVMSVERDLHSGTAGAIDEEFYASVERFMNRHNAPAGARTSVAFLRGLASWDFQAAAAAADSLMPAVLEGKPWVPLDDFRSGAIVAKLRVGDLAGARRIHSQLSQRTPRPPDDVRERLLSAYVGKGLGSRESGVGSRDLGLRTTQ